MTYVYPDPEAEALAFLDARQALWPDASYSVDYPAEGLAGPHIQFAWDGPQGEDENRESCLVRFTVWAPRGQRDTAKTLASLVRSEALAWRSGTAWRVTRGTGRTPGNDPDSELPFVTFSVVVDMRPTAAPTP